jgi:hypothetical protein
MNLIVTTKEELTSIIESILKNTPLTQESKSAGAKDWLGFQESCDYLDSLGLGVSVSQLSKVSASGDIPHFKYMRRILFKKEDLFTWAQSKLNRVGGVDVSVALIAKAARKRS